jgi:DNA invertase Pin-like site-specific DNA recombinase
LGLEAQQEALRRFAEAEDYTFAETFKDVESAKHDEDHRPALKAAIERARKDGAPIIVAKLDRLSRDVHYRRSLHQRAYEAPGAVHCDRARGGY